MRRRLLIQGDRACFRRPEIKSDAITYDCITAQAASFIFTAVYPLARGRWRPKSVTLLKPIQTGWEEQGASSLGSRIFALRDVAYLVEAEAGGEGRRDLILSEKYEEPRGSAHLGLSEFPARISAADAGPLPQAEPINRDMGWMPYRYGQSFGKRPVFCRTVIVDGVIDYTALGPDDFAD